ncbi:class I SAM-dependent methyltransferase [Paenibacillus sp.]|uniref:tRNA (mnm(5)s(2)U34)-methyltransferase n=1 Tax=Paenibacillus sp. TaxID=58172 RepID=UPI002D5E8D01|nr:class I SAM-dependent methyltransferase [Paenibacillus sp.]HZG83924.1 class I SAM-dependent methyltransferase [Paenibacillus sp.]
MGFLSVLSFAHAIVRDRVRPGDIAVDATMGNGHDTLFLAGLAGDGGHVYAFDIQETALANTAERLASSGIPSSRYTLLLSDHAEMAQRLPAAAVGGVAAVMFNLGYLPGADHSVITRTPSTLRALDAALAVLRPGGAATVVVYPGHAGGADEAAAVEAWAAALDPSRYQAMVYRFVNQRNAPPYVIAVEKRKSSFIIHTSNKGERNDV